MRSARMAMSSKRATLFMSLLAAVSKLHTSNAFLITSTSFSALRCHRFQSFQQHSKHVSFCNINLLQPHRPPAALMISNGSNEGHGEGVTRSDLIDSGIRNLAAAVAAVGMVASTAAGNDLAHAADVREPEMTSKCYIEVKIMEPLNEANGYSSSNAYRGKLVFGLYGKACPKATENFLRYGATDRTKDQPSYASGLMTKMQPGLLVEGGKIPGLSTVNIGGQEELEFDGEVLYTPSLLENTELQHSRRGLLTRDRLSRGPEFGITLGPAPELDGSHEVFGRLVQGEDVLDRLERIPIYGSNRLEPGSMMDKAFRAQNRALVNLGKNVFKDGRAVDRTGLFLRRVDIVSCGIV